MRSIFLTLIISIFIFSCSSSDDSSDDPNNPGNTAGDYFPLHIDNSWTYDVTNVSPTNPEFNYTETDVVTLNSANTSVFTVDVNAPIDNAFGTANSVFNSGSMSKNNTSLLFTGDVSLLPGIDNLPDNSISLTNFVVYNTDASTNSTLDTDSGSFTQDEDFDGTIIPVTTNYTISNINKATLGSLTVNGESYSDVVHTQIIINIDISAVVDLGGISTTQSILSPQDVVIIDNYFANNIGLIKSVADQNFTIDNSFIQILNLLGIPIDFDTNGSLTNTQDISSFTITQ